MAGKTLFDKIWDKHIVEEIKNGPSVLYIDRQFIHEVTSPQAFAGLDARGIKVRKPAQITATPDHNVPTIDQHLAIEDDLSRTQVETLSKNCENHDVEIFNLGHDQHGVVHIIGPEMGFTQPGMTIVCGDSHTATHGAFGAIAFGIGTSEVEMVLASQCLMQHKPKRMKITIDGELGKGVTSKDIILYIISIISTSGGTGYFVEYAGSAITSLSMESRMTICNMSIEMGARGGMIAPDQTTFDYVKGRERAPQGADFDAAVEEWKELYTDADAVFDEELNFDAADIGPMVTYGTTPGMGIAIDGNVPKVSDIDEEAKISFKKSLEYMGIDEGQQLLGKKIDWVFVGSCTNGRIEDFRAFADIVKGKQKAAHIKDLIVPGSRMVEDQIIAEGLKDIIEAAGFKVRRPGCSACLAMNDDKVAPGEYCVATSNRNFEGRQGPQSRTFLASPITAAASAIEGKVADVRKYL